MIEVTWEDVIPSNRGDISDDEPLPEYSHKFQRKREYQRNCYHMHTKKPVERDRCQKIYSIASAMRRRRQNKVRCRQSRMQTQLEQLRPTNP